MLEQRPGNTTKKPATAGSGAAFPGLGEEVERRGSRTSRRFTIGGPLPDIVRYSDDVANERAPVWLVMLMHEDQDRERFRPDRFE